MIRNNISLKKMLTYLFFLSPMLIYELTPICVLVAVLVNLAVLSKQNEVTAFKACGVSLYRMAVPILIVSTLLSGGLFAFDYYYVPGPTASRTSCATRSRDRPVQTYYRPDRKWIMGEGFRIYYYRLFDPTKKPWWTSTSSNCSRTRSGYAPDQGRAGPLERSVGTWIFENGWNSDFKSDTEIRTRHEFQATTFRS